MENNKENAIEFITGQKTATVTFTNQKYINRIKKLHTTHTNEFTYLVENNDGSICASIPLKWIKISPPKQISEEQRLAASDRFKKMRSEGKS